MKRRIKSKVAYLKRRNVPRFGMRALGPMTGFRENAKINGKREQITMQERGVGPKKSTYSLGSRMTRASPALV